MPFMVVVVVVAVAMEVVVVTPKETVLSVRGVVVAAALAAALAAHNLSEVISSVRAGLLPHPETQGRGLPPLEAVAAGRSGLRVLDLKPAVRLHHPEQVVALFLATQTLRGWLRALG
jgi:hypothetical protein